MMGQQTVFFGATTRMIGHEIVKDISILFLKKRSIEKKKANNAMGLCGDAVLAVVAVIQQSNRRHFSRTPNPLSSHSRCSSHEMARSGNTANCFCL
jgi:hypothetical protein